LDKPEWGQAAFLESHLPGAQFLDLDRDLSSQVKPGVTGRHPLPQPQALASTLRDKGVNESSIVVVYDDGPGFFAARAWWLLRWLGHDKVVVDRRWNHRSWRGGSSTGWQFSGHCCAGHDRHCG